MTRVLRASSRRRGGRGKRDALDWLLEDNQPAIRYRTLTEMLDRMDSDPEAHAVKNEILRKGWAAEVLARRGPRGGWEDDASQYQPKYISTNWMMLILSDLGLTRVEPVVAQLCDLWMRGFAAKDGGLGGNSKGTPHYCVAANMARALIRFGYSDDPRVVTTMERLARDANPKGGWSCWGSGRNLDSWEAMSAFAVYPRAKWTGAMQRSVEKGAEFFLQRHLHQQGGRYAPWYRFHYPIHYYYDLLVGLDFMTALGYAGDPRMGYALKFLRSRRRPDGTWNLDAVHPDVEGPIAAWFADHPRHRPIPFALEKAGEPSKMITLTALRVLKAADKAASTGPERR
jgi:hypothetical protein